MAKKILLLCLSGLLSLSVFAAGKSFRLDDGIAEISGSFPAVFRRHEDCNLRYFRFDSGSFLLCDRRVDS